MYDIYSKLQLSYRIETIGRSSECMYAPIYSQVDILLRIRGDGRAGQGHLDRSVGMFSSPRNLSSGQHSRARRVRMEVSGRGRVVEVAVCIYGAVVW